jgi:hypothetical protein
MKLRGAFKEGSAWGRTCLFLMRCINRMHDSHLGAGVEHSVEALFPVVKLQSVEIQFILEEEKSPP